MLEMNREEFDKAMEDLKAQHASSTTESESRIAALEELLKAEREKASAVQHVSQSLAGEAVACTSLHC